MIIKPKSKRAKRRERNSENKAKLLKDTINQVRNSENKAKLLKDTINQVRSNTFSILVSPEEFKYSVENVAKLQIDLKNLEIDIENLEFDIENKEREIVKKDNIFENLKTTNDQQESEIIRLQTSVANQEKEIESLHTISKEKTQKIIEYQKEFNRSCFETIALKNKLDVQRKTLKKLASSEKSIFEAYQKRILQMSETLQPLQNESEKKKVEFEAISGEITSYVNKIEEANDILKNLRTTLDTTYKTIDLFHDKLYDSIQNQNGKLQCVICTEKTRSITFAPCHHFVSCDECSSRVSKCPICNGIITSRQITFF